MKSLRRRIFSIFSLVLVLLGVSGVNISGAATKYTVPSAPSNVKAVGNLEYAVVSWKAPSSNGGKEIKFYKVASVPSGNMATCDYANVGCRINIKNPNKPSSNPKSVAYSFVVVAVNNVGTGPSSQKSAPVLIRFRATTYIAPKYGTPTPTPSAIPTPSPTPTPIPDNSPTTALTLCGQGGVPLITAFDGSYHGQAIVTITQNAATPSSATSTIPTTFTIHNGRGTGSADIWSVDGCVTDATGGGTVVASNNLYGAITFAIKLTLDSTTHTMGGTGKGTNTFSVPGFGSITVEFALNVATTTNQ